MVPLMEILNKYSFFSFLIVFVFVVHAQDDQSGFISIDCGLPKSSGGYSELITGINYISDETFINTGVSETILPEHQSGFPEQLAHLRAFPEGIRNCCTINITRGTTYLIRATFYYGNYDNKSYPPGFDIHLGANYWDTIIFYLDLPLEKEIIHVPLDEYVRVWLVNNGTGTPFISALELRPLPTNTYVTQSGSLVLYTRVDLGSITNISYRYPYDALDRSWSCSDFNNYKPNWTTMSTPFTVNPDNTYKIPSEIMSTAITPTNASEPLIYTWFPCDSKAYYVYLHFSEIQELKPNQSRSFNIIINGELSYENLTLYYLNVITMYSTSPLAVVTSTSGNYTMSIIKHKSSTLPPVLNAIEIYTLVDFSQSETNQDDAELIAKSKNGSLSLSFDTANSEGDNINQCSSSPFARKKKNNVMIPIVASIGGFVSLLFVAAAILVGIKRKRKQGVAPGISRSRNQNNLFESKNRQFTYSEAQNITNHFVRILGKGGFGTVYHGCIGDTEVAVKKLSPSSVQGYRQFQAEVKLLMTVHHRNLTSLVGYCIEEDNMALIYEYMTNGDLLSYLLDEDNTNVLSWERRPIALDAAQGLEYLHNGCKPPIVHRDVKTTNILLTENFQAKLADFGLSRTFPTDGGSHVSTVVAGTPGYLELEYATTNRLTEKSAVNSFGVVLLQIITCRSPILIRGHERTHIKPMG